MLRQLLLLFIHTSSLSATPIVSRKLQFASGSPDGGVCCGGGSSCGFTHCPLQASSDNGCIRPWLIDRTRPCNAAPEPAVSTSAISILGPRQPQSPVTASNTRCAIGFCENPADCPRCPQGHSCVARSGNVCAGTCFGICQTSTVAVPCRLRDSHGRCVPTGCVQWFDGCNQCRVMNGRLACTRMFCASPTSAVCVQHSPGH